jgi:hypothetical protein
MAQKSRSARKAQRGAAMTEYLVVLLLVTLVAATATLPLEAMLIAYYRALVFLIDLPIP